MYVLKNQCNHRNHFNQWFRPKWVKWEGGCFFHDRSYVVRRLGHPGLQPPLKSRVIHFYLINMCIVLNIKYKFKFAWYLTFPPQRTNKYLKTTILKALLMKK